MLPSETCPGLGNLFHSKERGRADLRSIGSSLGSDSPAPAEFHPNYE